MKKRTYLIFALVALVSIILVDAMLLMQDTSALETGKDFTITLSENLKFTDSLEIRD